MIELYGQIKPQRLRGRLNVVPSESGAGGPLQAKTVYPSHSEQVIAPDEDYYGLVSVTVKPVPRLPACVASVETPSGIEYYYNHEQLPEIPAEVAEEYPFIVVVRSVSLTRIHATKQEPYVHEVDGVMRLTIPAGGRVQYTYNSAADAWLGDAASTATTYMKLYGTAGWAVWWSNFDIPNGSADAEEIYWYASQPQTEQPADATHFYYNGVKLPAIPADVLAQYPYVWIRKDGANSRYNLVFSIDAWYFGNGVMVCKNNADLPYYSIDFDTADNAISWTYTANGGGTNFGINESRTILWSNHGVPNGSADAEEIYYYGTPAVPDPV